MQGPAGSATGQWRGKALIVRPAKDGKNQSTTVDLQIVAREPNALRIDVTGPMGLHLASMAANETGVRILLPREKKFLATAKGTDPSRAHAPALPGQVTPNELLAILFDRPLEREPGWMCSRGGSEIVFSCFDDARNARVIRRASDNGERRFELSDRSSKAELVLYEAKAKVEPVAKTFELQAPAGFKQETIK